MSVRIKDVARYAGVSSATVSRVLTKKPHVSQAVRERVMSAVQTLGYQPNRVARSLRVQRSSVLGLIISDIQNSFFTAMVRAVEDVAYRHGYAVVLCNSDEDPRKERLYIDLLSAERVAGVVLTPAKEGVTACDALLKAGIPVVAVDRRVPGLDIDTVCTDNIAAAAELVGHLVRQGHRRIGAVLSDLEITTGRERFEGYRRALEIANLPIHEELVLTGEPFEREGYRMTRLLLGRSERPTALFTGSKLLTKGALRALYEAGLRVPQDIAVVAFDELDWMPFNLDMVVAAQPTYAIGETAARLLLERLRDPSKPAQTVTLPSELRINRSLASAKEIKERSSKNWGVASAL